MHNSAHVISLEFIYFDYLDRADFQGNSWLNEFFKCCIKSISIITILEVSAFYELLVLHEYQMQHPAKVEMRINATIVPIFLKDNSLQPDKLHLIKMHNRLRPAMTPLLRLNAYTTSTTPEGMHSFNSKDA